MEASSSSPDLTSHAIRWDPDEHHLSRPSISTAKKTDDEASGSEITRRVPLIVIVAVSALLMVGMVVFYISSSTRVPDAHALEGEKESSTAEEDYVVEARQPTPNDLRYTVHGTEHFAEGNSVDEATMENDASSTKQTPSTTATTLRTTRTTLETSTQATLLLPQEPIPSMPLICTYGRFLHHHVQPPPEGFCDLVVYTSVSFSSDAGFQDHHKRTRGLERFLEFAQKSLMTGYGLALRSGDAISAVHQLQVPLAFKPFEKLFQENVRHYGILDVDFSKNFNTTMQNAVLDVLKLLRTIQKQLWERYGSVNKTAYTLLGLSIIPTTDKKQKEALKNRFVELISNASVDAVILRTHSNQKDTDTECRITGPTLWEGTYNGGQHTIRGTLAFLENLAVPVPDNVSLALSLTLAGRLYKPTSKGVSASTVLGSACIPVIHSRMVEWTSLCTSMKGGVTVLPNADVAFALVNYGNESRVYTLDTTRTIKSKMCKVHRLQPTRQLGWAVFDLEYADEHNVCKDNMVHSKYPRLRLVFDMLQQIRTRSQIKC